MTMLPIVLIGGGGHASDVLQAIEAVNTARSTYHVIGILDDHEIDPRRFAGRGVAHIGAVDEVAVVDAAYVVCLGWPWTRHAVARRIGEAGQPAPPIVHPSADVGVGVELGPGSVVLGHAHLSPFVRFGAHAVVSYIASIGHDTTFGDHVSVMPNAAVSGGVTGGHRVLVGTGAAVREGLRLGDDVRIGAGASVVSDVTAGLTVVGVPARPRAGDALPGTAMETDRW
jgi:sugar O-acyltransferase (sialic acid O-acetyltransferase NeuD family)